MAHFYYHSVVFLVMQAFTLLWVLCISVFITLNIIAVIRVELQQKKEKNQRQSVDSVHSRLHPLMSSTARTRTIAFMVSYLLVVANILQMLDPGSMHGEW